MKKPILYIVAVPIGNYKDFTFRAVETLMTVDMVIGEERATTERLLKIVRVELNAPLSKGGKGGMIPNVDTSGLELSATEQIHETSQVEANFTPTIFILNEHNEKEETITIFNYIVENKLSAALISEAGTPCFADPGASLVDLFHKNNLTVIPIPGVSSIMATMMVSGVLDNQGFYYFGFLSPKTEIRQSQLKKLNKEKLPVIIMETPYRMKPLLKDIQSICESDKRIVFAYKLTQPEELIIKSTISDVINKTKDLKKGEFVIILT